MANVPAKSLPDFWQDVCWALFNSGEFVFNH
jgi:hypothetical protein